MKCLLVILLCVPAWAECDLAPAAKAVENAESLTMDELSSHIALARKCAKSSPETAVYIVDAARYEQLRRVAKKTATDYRLLVAEYNALLAETNLLRRSQGVAETRQPLRCTTRRSVFMNGELETVCR